MRSHDRTLHDVTTSIGIGKSMRRKLKGYLALFLAALSALTGCTPTQPLYLRE